MQTPAYTFDLSVILLPELIILIGTILIVSMINRRSMFFKNVSLTFLVLNVIVWIGMAPNNVNESRAYLADTIPILFANFSTDTVFRYMAPEDRGKLDHAAMDRLTAETNEKFGHYKYINMSTCNTIKYTGLFGRQPVMTCRAYLTFEKSPVIAFFDIKKSGNQWYLVRVDVEKGTEIFPL